MSNLLALADATELVGDFRIERVLGAGGFGITYLARELALDRLVTIKEYFPADFAARDGVVEAAPRSQDCASDYRWGLDRFIEEAQTLAKFDHPNIVRVYRYFRANNTGYIVLHFEEGLSLKGWLKSLGRTPRQAEIDHFLGPLLDALEVIHGADFLHRDIAPDNIIIRKDRSPVLIDFGSARGDVARATKTLSALVKPGYSAYEQYGSMGRQQGPWSDIYSLAATLYQAITAKRPQDAPSRMVADELVPAREAALGAYRARFLAAIDKGLALAIEDRPRSVASWRVELSAEDKRPFRRKPSEQVVIPALPAEPEPVLVAAAGSATRALAPPPPDAPAEKGRLLDFIEGLKKKQEARRQAATPEPPQEPTARSMPAAPKAETAPTPAPAPARLPAVVERAPPRPQPMRAQRSRGRWRSLTVKLLIGLGIASAAVGMQDKLPRIESRGAGIVTSQTGEVAVVRQIRSHKGAATGVAFTDDGRHIVTAGADGTLKVWSAASGSLVRTIELDDGAAAALALSERRAATGHKDGQVVLWDLDRGDKLASFKRNGASIWSVAFAGETTRIAASGHDWAVTLWDTRNRGQPVHVFEGHESAAQAVAYSAKGSWLASAGADRLVKLWHPASQSLVRTYRGHTDFVTALAFAPDGRTLASAGLDGGIRLWSTAGNRYLRTLRGHKGRVGSIAFSPSGHHLASAGADGAVRLWDVRRGRTVRTFSGDGVLRAVAFAADGRVIASAGEDGMVRLWDATPPPQKD